LGALCRTRTRNRHYVVLLPVLELEGRHGVHVNATSRARYDGHEANRNVEARPDSDWGVKSVDWWVARQPRGGERLYGAVAVEWWLNGNLRKWADGVWAVRITLGREDERGGAGLTRWRRVASR